MFIVIAWYLFCSNQQEGYAMNLVACRDARVGFPTVQSLLERTCIHQKVKLNKVIGCF